MPTILDSTIIFKYLFLNFKFPVAEMIKRLPTMQETPDRSLGWEDPLEKKWQPTPVLLP